MPKAAGQLYRLSVRAFARGQSYLAEMYAMERLKIGENAILPQT
jgi:hypothetical protein